MSILCYHSVDPEWTSELALPPSLFEAHCAWLARRHQAAPLSDLLVAYAEGRRLRGVVGMTFDDGLADFKHFALPILRRFQFPSTMFVVARCLEDGAAAADWFRPQPTVAPPTLTADDVLELQDLGVDLGSHSWAHHDLRTLSEEECFRDLRDSRERLEDLLRRDVRVLAYPYGFHAAHVRNAAARAGYDYALSLPEGPEPQGLMAVPRAGLYRANSVNVLRVKASRWYAPLRMNKAYPTLRSVLRRSSTTSR